MGRKRNTPTTDDKIIEILHRIYKASGEPITAKAIATRMGVTPSFVNKCFRKHKAHILVLKDPWDRRGKLYVPKYDFKPDLEPDTKYCVIEKSLEQAQKTDEVKQ